MSSIITLVLLAFIAWGVTPFEVTIEDTPYQKAPAAAAILQDDSCGIFIGPLFYVSVAYGAPEWFPQAVITYEIGHCLGLDHPEEYKLSIMVPNVPSPTVEDLRLIHDFRYKVFVSVN